MAAREIPGYYYDAEKNKYFKIAKNHTVPTNAPYSAETVRKRKAEDEAQRQKRWLVTSNEGRIKRAEVLRNPLLGAAVVRESGRLDCNWDATATLKAYTEGWRATEVLASIQRGWDGTRFTEREADMCAFDVDFATGMLLFASDKNMLQCAVRDWLRTTEIQYEEHTEKTQKSWWRQSVVYAGTDVINSITIDPVTKLVLTTWQAAPMGHNAFLTKIEGNGLFAPVNKQWRLQTSSRDPNPKATVRCATAAPAGSPYAFVVGGEHELFGVRRDDGEQSSFIKTASSGLDEPDFAVEFLTESPSVLLTGKRSGRINILDLRIPLCRSGVEGIEHASSVARIKQVAEHAVVVAGLENTLCVYDLRYRKHTTDVHMLPSAPARASRGKKSPARHYTFPVVTMTQHRNEIRHDADVAVDRQAGLVTAAQVEGESNPVRIFSVRTGEVVRTLDPTHTGSTEDRGHVRQLRFVEDRGKGLPKSLWIAKGAKIVEYAW